MARNKGEAITSPSAIVAAGAGAALVVASGLPLALAPIAALAAWAAGVSLAMPRRRPRQEAVRPERLPDPWRGLVVEAVDADRRFHLAVVGCRPGPLREQLESVARRVNDGLRACWTIARHGAALDDAVAHLDVAGTRRELADVQAELGAGSGRPDLEATAEALQSQLESAARLAATVRETHDKLRRLVAELEEAVARAVELSLRATAVGQLGSQGLGQLGDDIDSVVVELETLGSALESAAS
jgi:hypothetical protein